MVGALAAVLLLPGCGRKGPLDPPPASSQLQPGAPPQSAPGAPPEKSMHQDFDEDGRPVAPPGRKVHQFLDWLLN